MDFHITGTTRPSTNRVVEPVYSGGMTPASRVARASLVLASVVLFGSCAQLGLPPLAAPGAVPITPPSVTFVGATLVRAPSTQALAAHYCPELVQAPLGTGPLLCRQAFGPPPPPSAMVVSFDLVFRVANPNQVPLPLASALVATTLFPASTGEKLGAVCVSICPEGAAGCTGEAPPGACEASSRDVRSLNDFVDKSLPRLLISEGIALANGQAPSFTLPPITASSQVDVTVRYSFGPEQLLAVMRDLAAQSVNELKNGRLPTFTIPYRLEGTVWFDAGSIGRIAVGWGPTAGTWTLPVAGLVPAVIAPAMGAPPSYAPPRGAPPPAPAGAPPSVP
jgi:hypothetical protein